MEPQTDSNLLVKPNEFLRKVLDAKTGKDARVFEFERYYDEAHNEFWYKVGLEILGTVIYSHTYVHPRDRRKNMDEIFEKALEEKQDFIEAVENGDLEELTRMARRVICDRHLKDDGFAGINDEDWWETLDFFDDFFMEKGPGSPLERYCLYIGEFKEQASKRAKNMQKAKGK